MGNESTAHPVAAQSNIDCIHIIMIDKSVVANGPCIVPQFGFGEVIRHTTRNTTDSTTTHCECFRMGYWAKKFNNQPIHL